MTGGENKRGPWSAFIMGKTVAVDIGPHPTGNRPNIVDWTGFDGCDLPLDQQIANARLIAAAPDLLDAAKDALWALDNVAAILSALGLESTLSDPTIALRAAIAKAEGGAE